MMVKKQNSFEKRQQNGREGHHHGILFPLTSRRRVSLKVLLAVPLLGYVLISLILVQMHQNILATTTPLHIYYINLDRSIDRRSGLEQDIRELPPHLQSVVKLHRVPAVNVNDVQRMLSNGTFVMPNGVDVLANTRKRFFWIRF